VIGLLIEVVFVHTFRIVLAIAGIFLIVLAGLGFSGPVWRGKSKPGASLALLGAACLALATELPLIAS
jgi:drug/metabolite transporter (DMT)-like permease